MRILRLAPVHAARQGSEAEQARRSLVGVAALALVVIAAILAPAGAQAACEGTCTEEQAATGLAKPPAWAEGRTMHFEPETLGASAYTAGELEGEGEGGPLLFSEAGSVQHTPKVYVIFWGSNFKTTEKGTETNTMVQNLLKGLTGTAYQGILTQYFDTTGRISSTVTPTFYFDESLKAPESVNALKVEEEVSAAVSANKWTPETSAQFLLMTAPGSTYETTTGCAYHGVTRASTKVTAGIVYDFVPYQGDPPFSTNGCVEIGNPTKNPVFKTSKSVSHEYAEAATDPLLNAWRAGSGAEISDICQAQNIVELSSGAWVQNQYDNHQNSCSHEDLNPPFAYAITGAASGIKSTEATLNGTVNPENLSSQYYFEYGATKSYGSKTAEVSAGSGIKNVAASKLVSGLTSSTTYHFRVAEVNSTGTTTGEDHTFTTSAGSPPTITTGTATGVTATEAILHGTINPNGFSATDQFEYGTTISYGTTVPAVAESAGSGVAAVEKGYVLTGLLPSTTYHFRIKGTSSQGTSLGKDATFTTSSLTPTFSSNFGSSGTGNGQFNQPTGIAVNPLNGNLVVPDEGNNRVEIFNEKGEYLSQFGSLGTGNGQFTSPRGAAVDLKGNIWVIDTGNNRVEKFNNKGEFVTKFGSLGSGAEQMNYPVGVAVDPRGNIWIDDNNNRIDHWKVSSPWPPTFSSNFGSSGTGNGQFSQPTGIAVNPLNGNLVVPDEGNNRVEIFNEKGEYLSQFGSFGTGNGQFNQPRGAAVDPKGSIWVIDTGNNRVEKFSNGVYVSQFGTKGTGNGQLTTPKNLAVDSKGNVWVADSGNNRIEKFNEKGEYLLQFSAGTNPIGIAVDANGNVWTDNDNATGAIEEHNEKGEFVKNFATRGSGNGQVFEPKRLAVDANGYIWVPDALNNRVEVFNERGEYVTKFGSFGSGSEQMNYPVGVAVDLKGNVWVDDNNNRVDHWIR